MLHAVITSDVDSGPSFLDLLGVIDNGIFYGNQLSITQDPSDTTFNEHGYFRDIGQQDMHYIDTLECNSYEDINNLIDTCIEFDKTTPNDNCIDKNVCSCNSVFKSLASSFIKKNLALVTTCLIRRIMTTLSCNLFSWFPIDIIKKTFETTTQCGYTSVSTIFKSNCKYPFLRSKHESQS